MPKIIIPFEVKAIYSDANRSITAPSADFSKMPYFDENNQEIINPSQPYISENLVAQPFHNQNMILETGLHLHFILPEILRTQDPDDNYIPAVPNRWLIKTESKKWLIESDFLYSEYTVLKNKVTTPIPWEKLEAKKLNVPFRYWGRQYELSTPNTAVGDYWYNIFDGFLTAEGYGDVGFGASLPNCKNIFTFHDDSSSLSKTYEIWGWYDIGDQTQTAIDTIFNYYLANSADEKQTLEEAWGITFKDGEYYESNENDILLYAKVTIGDHSKITPNDIDTNFDIAVGNSSTESTAAFLGTISRKKKTIENKLEAIQISSLNNLQADLINKFFEARHEKSFRPIESGIQYHLENEICPRSPNDATTIRTLFDELLETENIKQAFNTIHQNILSINDLLHRYDKKVRSIGSKRHQLFADWYKYMVAVNPPYKQQKDYPPADDILRYMFQGAVRQIIDTIKSTGFLTIDPDSHIPTPPTTPNNESDSLAQKIIDTFNTLKDNIKALNATIKQEKNKKIDQGDNQFEIIKDKELIYNVFTKASQRYYEANEPVVMIAIKEEDTQTTTPTEIICLSDNTIWESLDCTIQKEFPTAAISSIPPIQYQRYQHQWLSLEWEVTYTPIGDSRDAEGNYPNDFIFKHFDLTPDTPDFSPLSNTSLSHELRRYTGITYLNDSTKEIVTGSIERFIEEQNPPDSDLVKAKKKLEKCHILTQSLGGFNQALLMRKQTMQLEIADPLAFGDYLPLIEIIRNTIGDSRESAPEPKHFFNPIRGGILTINRLRLVDTFGLSVEVYNEDVSDDIVKSQPLEISDNFIFNAGIKNLKPKALYLPPRFAQPARLNVNWIGSNWDDDTIKITDKDYDPNPICGWIMPNFLENNFALFDQVGTYLGSMGISENKVELFPKPGSDTFVISDIGNEHLRNFVQYFIAVKPDENAVSLFNKFTQGIEDTLDYTEPENFAQYAELALLVGKPMALTRVSIELELMEDYAINQDWNAFKVEIYHKSDKPRDTKAFEKVQVPIRLGDYDQLNDGIIGYWYKENRSTPYTINATDVLYMPFYEKKKPKKLTTLGQEVAEKSSLEEGRKSFLITQSLNQVPQVITMLMDPLGALNITSGLLPVKTIRIPDAYFKSTLEKIHVHFLVSPIITPYQQFQMPLLKYTHNNWHWVSVNQAKGHQKRYQIVDEIPIEPTITKLRFQRIFVKQMTDLMGNKCWGELINEKVISPVNDDEAPNDPACCTLDNVDAVDRLSGSFDMQKETIKRILKTQYRVPKNGALLRQTFIAQYQLEIVDKVQKEAAWTQLIDKNWLTPLEGQPLRYYINFELKSRKKLDDYLDESLLNDLLNNHFEGIGEASDAPQFRQMVIQEGWLKMV